MIRRLRRFWDRPIRDAERLPAFIAAALLIVGSALGFALLRPQDQAPAAAERRTPPAVAGRATSATSPAPIDPDSGTPTNRSLAADPAAGAERARAAQGAQRRRLASAERAAQRFLRGYLRFTYGQGEARAISSISPALAQRLAATLPRVDRRTRALAPRVAGLQAENLGATSVELIAFVDDGVRAYSFPLRLEHGRGGWRVSGLAGV